MKSVMDLNPLTPIKSLCARGTVLKQDLFTVFKFSNGPVFRENNSLFLNGVSCKTFDSHIGFFPLKYKNVATLKL